MRRLAYTSTVFGPVQLMIGAVLALLLAAFILVLSGPWWTAVLAGAIVLATAMQLAVVRLAIGSETVRIASGWWGIGKRVLADREILEAEPVDLTAAQTYWRPPSARSGPVTRLTVRAGATLRLRLKSGETLWISTVHPEHATELIKGRNDS